jgi:sugar lactone lactonase YvrE
MLSVHADLTDHAAGYLNDFAVDDVGRIYVGNFGYDYDGGEGQKPTSLHRVDPDGTIVEVAQGVEFPNGSVIIDKGRTLVVAETWAGRLTAFDLSGDGLLSNKRVLADLGNRQPDGICADANGGVWAGCFNTGEFVYVRDGQVKRSVQFEGAAVSCVIGGDSGKQLFMTVYRGSVEDIAAHRRKAAIYVLNLGADDLSRTP